LPEAAYYKYWGGIYYMELTVEQEEEFKEACGMIKPGAYGQVRVTFIGEPSNIVEITGEKTRRFYSRKTEAAHPIPS
jgi:hypothetical protein